MDFLKSSKNKYILPVVGGLLVLGAIYYVVKHKTHESPRDPTSQAKEGQNVQEEKKAQD